MRPRNSHVLAFAGSVALALILILISPAGIPSGPPAGMSAPSAPLASIESAHAAKLLQSHFDWNGPALVSAGLACPLILLPALVTGRRGLPGAPAYYGPLHQRPPPSFS